MRKLFNHEVWTYCKECKEWFDARINGNTICPNCGKECKV